jgi:hypothetical protein
MKKQNLIYITISIIIILLIFSFSFVYLNNNGFQVNSLFIKSVLRQGDLIDSSVTVLNTKKEAQLFNIKLEGLKGIAELSDKGFVLNPNQEKKISILFKNSSFDSGIYVGNLIIQGSETTKEIPITIELQSKDLVFAANIDVSPVYEEIAPGDKFAAVIKILSLNFPEKRLVTIDYYIKDLTSKVIVADKEQIGIENEVVFTKSLSIPKDLSEGKYVFGLEIKYKDFVTTSSNLFEVKKQSLFIKNYLYIFLFILFLGVLILIYFVARERNNLFLSLLKQQKQQMNLLKEQISTRQRTALQKAKLACEKKVITKQYGLVLKKACAKLKETQKEQKKVFKKLKQNNKENEMKKKLEEWKKRGYDTSILESKMIGLNDIEKKINLYRKKGYNVDMFKK